ncbi:MAG: EamA family transporter [Bdellovibrionales bacterium]|nr:EamA family transporter [Bdellovibrionales bacterium]
MWLLLAFGSALASTCISSLFKVSDKHLDAVLVSCALAFGSFLFSGIALALTNDWEGNRQVYMLAAGVSAIDYIALLLYVKALRMSDISLVSPITAFTPFFILFVGPLINGQIPSSIGSLGVLLVVAGSYVMSLSKAREGVFAPIRALVFEPGCRLMIFASVAWAITSSFHSKGIDLSNPLTYSFVKGAMLSIALAITCLFRIPEWPQQLRGGMKLLGALAACSFLADMGMLFAMKGALVVYVISIKRSSILLNVLVGAWLFKEKNIVERLLGSLFILAGVCIIAMT